MNYLHFVEEKESAVVTVAAESLDTRQESLRFPLDPLNQFQIIGCLEIDGRRAGRFAGIVREPIVRKRDGHRSVTRRLFLSAAAIGRTG